MLDGTAVGEDLYYVSRVALAAHARGKGYYEYLFELRRARERFGPYAADFQLALDLEWATRKSKHDKKPPPRRGRRGI